MTDASGRLREKPTEVKLPRPIVDTSLSIPYLCWENGTVRLVPRCFKADAAVHSLKYPRGRLWHVAMFSSLYPHDDLRSSLRVSFSPFYVIKQKGGPLLLGITYAARALVLIGTLGRGWTRANIPYSLTFWQSGPRVENFIQNGRGELV